jgi:hypothetical protein
MSLNKSIDSGKERRRPYSQGKSTDPSCRNNNSCPKCKSKRLYAVNKNIQKAESIEHDVF